MLAYAFAALTCRCCALVTIPRPSLWSDAGSERRIGRLLGFRPRIVALALLLTARAALTPLPGPPSGVNPDLAYARSRHHLCTHPPIGFSICYRWVSANAWMREGLDSEGNWLDIGIVALAEVYGGETSDVDLPLGTPYIEDPKANIPGKTDFSMHSRHREGQGWEFPRNQENAYALPQPVLWM